MVDQVRVKTLPPFPSRTTVIAAANMLKAEGHSGFEALRLEYDLHHTDAGLGSGLMAWATSLATYALKIPRSAPPKASHCSPPSSREQVSTTEAALR